MSDQTAENAISLERQLLDIQSMVERIEVQHNNLAQLEERFKDDKKKLEEEYREAVYKLNEQNKEVHTQFQQVRKSLEEAHKQEESVQRRLEQQLANERAAQGIKVLEERWLALTENAKWREFAKPHQIAGATQISFARRMILADTVGLGKTLTAGVAATDIIKAATADGDTYTERMQFQEYHPRTELCNVNGCRSTNDPRNPDEMYGRCEWVRSAPPAGRRILYICPVALVRNVQSEYKKWSGARTNGEYIPPVESSGYIDGEVVSDDTDELIKSILGTESETPNLPAISEQRLEITTRMAVNLSKQSKVQRRFLINDVLADLDEFVVIINYEAWRKDASLIADLVKLNFDTCIIDEAHNIKDRKSIAYRGVRALLDGGSLTTGYGSSPEQLAEPIRFIIPMTGTPILNKPQELYSMLTLVDPKNFPNTTYGENNFLRDYCIQDLNYESDSYGKWKFRPGGVESLLQKFKNRIIRRDKKMAGIITPPQDIQYHELDIDEENYADQCRARQEMREKAMIILDPDRGEAITAPIMLAVYTRLRQIETWPDGIELKDNDGNILLKLNIKQSQKLDYIIRYDKTTEDWEGLLPEVCPSERTAIFMSMNAPMDELAERAKAYGLRVAFIRGGQSDAERNEIRIDADRYHEGIADYQTKYDLLLINYKAGGVGLNLNDFTQTIILDEEWNPGETRSSIWSNGSNGADRRNDCPRYSNDQHD
jgi:SNF2 family DNA or RNA helicase